MVGTLAWAVGLAPKQLLARSLVAEACWLLAEGGGAGWPGIAAGMRRELGGRRAVPLLQLIQAAVLRAEHPAVASQADVLADAAAAHASSQAAAAQLADVNMMKLLVRFLPVISAV